jgi:hypothetical protein
MEIGGQQPLVLACEENGNQLLAQMCMNAMEIDVALGVDPERDELARFLLREGANADTARAIMKDQDQMGSVFLLQSLLIQNEEEDNLGTQNEESNLDTQNEETNLDTQIEETSLETQNEE